MKWYYVERGERVGPVDDAELGELARGGRIQADTLVWCEGMAEWSRYGDLGSAAPEATAPAGAEVSSAACAECGRTFSTESMIRHGTAWVCAACKPVFLQKLREGVAVSKRDSRFAGFWIRFLAYLLDGIILGIFNFTLGFAAGAALGGSDEPGPIIVLLSVVQLLIAILYGVILIGKYGATLGKMACGLRVVVAGGSQVSYGRALGRWFGKILSGLILAIGYIMAAFDEEKRALHDRLCDTRVVYN